MYDRRIPHDNGLIEFTVFETEDPITCGDQSKTYGQLLADSWTRASAGPEEDDGETARPFVLLRASPNTEHPIHSTLEVTANNECIFLPVLSSAISTFDKIDNNDHRFDTQAGRRAEAHADMCSRSAVPAPPTIEGKPIVDNLDPFLVGTEEFDLRFDEKSRLMSRLDVPNRPIDHRQTYKVVAVGYCIAIKFLSAGKYTIHAEALGSDRLRQGRRYRSDATYEMNVN